MIRVRGHEINGRALEVGQYYAAAVPGSDAVYIVVCVKGGTAPEFVIYDDADWRTWPENSPPPVSAN